MRFERFDPVDAVLRPSEARVVRMLRLWKEIEGQRLVWSELSAILGIRRARLCMRAFDELNDLLYRHGWHAPLALAPEAESVSEDERAIARFVLTATEQDREDALSQATMLVSPMALLPLVNAAERVGLPLLCEECRERQGCPLTLQ